jgi:hypothetical protein
MTTFVEKLVVEIIVSLCVGAVLGLIAPLLSMPDEAVRQNQRLVCRRCESNASIEVEPDQVGPGDEPQ